MSFLSQALESLMPGLRDARAPFVSGFLWSLLLWLFMSESIPERGDATGFAHQAYELAAASGPTVSLFVGGLLVYVLGTMVVTASNPAVNALGALVEAVDTRIDEQRRIRRALKNHLAREANLQQRMAAAATEEKKNSERDDVEAVQAIISMIRSHRRFLIWYGRLGADNKAVPRESYSPMQKLTREVIGNKFQIALNAALDQTGAVIDPEAVAKLFFVPSFAARLEAEVGTDPLDVMRALDEPLYQTLDREKSERDFKLAVAPPVIAFGIFVATQRSVFGWIVVAMGIITLLSQSRRQSQAPLRALNLIAAKGLELPSMKAAAASAGESIRKVQWQQLKREKAAQPVPPTRTVVP